MRVPTLSSLNLGGSVFFVEIYFGLPFFSPSEVVFLTLPFFSTLKFCLGTVCGNLVSPTLRNPFFSTPHLFLLILCLVFFTLRLVVFTRSLLVSPRNLGFLTLNLKQPKPAPHPTQPKPTLGPP